MGIRALVATAVMLAAASSHAGGAVDDGARFCARYLANPGRYRDVPQRVRVEAQLTDYYDFAFSDARDTHFAVEIACGEQLLVAYADKARFTTLFSRLVGRSATVELTLVARARHKSPLVFAVVGAKVALDDDERAGREAGRQLAGEWSARQRLRKKATSRPDAGDPMDPATGLPGTGWISPTPTDGNELAGALLAALAARSAKSRTDELTRLTPALDEHFEGAVPLLERAGALERLLSVSHTLPDVHRAIVRAAATSVATQRASALAALRATERDVLEWLLVEAHKRQLIRPLFAELISAGLYEALMSLLGDRKEQRELLRLLAEARPSYEAGALNEPTLRAIAAEPAWERYPHDFLIVPGFTPVRSRRPVALDELPAAQRRLDLAIEDLLVKQRAPFVIVTGGSVHPSGTPHNEALMMRAYLIAHGVPADRILVDPFARHSTTNLRNAGRFMLDAKRTRGLIVTGFESATFSQAFYFAHPVLSTFNVRCQRELGYRVGELAGVDEHHITFVPAAAVTTPLYGDPLDF